MKRLSYREFEELASENLMNELLTDFIKCCDDNEESIEDYYLEFSDYWSYEVFKENENIKY